MILRHKLRRELYDAGLEYGSLVRHYYTAKGISLAISEGHSGSGAGITEATTKWLTKELDRIEKPLRRIDSEGFNGLLAVYEREIDASAELATTVVLAELGVLLRKVGR